MTITEFLLARIAEDEAVALAATPGHWYADEVYATITAEPFRSAREAYDRDRPDIDCWVIPESMDSGVGDHNLAHIARHDPARMLAECEAKRRTVKRFVDTSYFEPKPSNAYDLALLDVMHDLAAVYADHPDYDESWRP